MDYEHNITPRKIIPEVKSDIIVVSVPNKPDITIRKIETEYEEEIFEEAPEILVVNGVDGYTPIKGVDYFDGKDGKKGDKGKDGKTPTKTELKAFIKEMFPEDKLLEKLIKKLPKAEVDSIEIGEDNNGQWIAKNGKKMYIKKQFSVGAGMSTGVYDFIALRDAPDSYVGQAGKAVKVKSDETGLEFGEVSGGTPTLQQVTDEGNTTTNDIIVPDEAYGAGWNGDLSVPTKNALYDKIQTLQPAGTYVTGATSATLTLTGTTLGINLANANTWTGQQIFNKADSNTVIPPPSNLVISFTPDGSGFYAGGTNYSYIIYSYQGGAYDIVGTANNATDPNDGNYYYIDLGWDSAGSVDGYFIYDTNGGQYVDVGSTLSYQITPFLSWTGGSPPSSPSSIITIQNSIKSQGDKDESTQDINVFEFGVNPHRLYWDYVNQYLRFEDSAFTLKTLRANINADSIYSNSYAGAWNGSAINTNYGGTGLTSFTQGDIPYYTSGTSLSKLAKNTSATRYLSNTGINNAPAWSQINLANGVTGTLPVANGGTGASTAPYVTNATNSTLTRSGSGPYTLGINLANANTWTGAQTIQVGTNADGVFQIKNSAGSNRFGYSTSKDQLSVGDAGYNSAAGFFYIYDVTHSFKDVFTIIKLTWGSAFDIQIATLSPVIKATGGATFVNYTINDTGTYLYNSFVSGATFDIRNDTDNYNTMGFYAKAFNNNPTPSFYLAAKRCVSYGVVGEAQSNPTGFGGAGLRSYSASANIDGVRVDVLAGQTAPLFRARQVNSFYDAYMSSVTDIMTIDAQGCVNPASMADGAAANNSIYYSTTASKLVYKDAGGTVNNLY